MPEEPHLREKQIHNNTGEGQSVSSLVQFVCNAGDVCSHMVEHFYGFCPVRSPVLGSLPVTIPCSPCLPTAAGFELEETGQLLRISAVMDLI